MFVAAILLLAAVLASKLSARLGIPALLLFLVVGMLAGSDGPGGIYFDNAELAQGIGTVALAFILFAGGLDTEWQSIRPVVIPALSLALIGVLVTAGLVGIFAYLVLGLTPLIALLLGAIVSSTDAAAVFSVLRSRNIRLRGSLTPLVELESGSNDPMAVFLTIGLIQLITAPATQPVTLLWIFGQQMILGVVLGVAGGRAMVWILDKVKLESEGLYAPLLIGLVLLLYSANALLGGSGFLAVYLAGIVMRGFDFEKRTDLIRFQDGIAWLMQIIMFLTLGLHVFPSRLVPVILPGLFLSAFLILIARPISVFIALSPFHFDIRDKTFVSWVGLRGAVPIILATFPFLAGIPEADMLFNLVFFIVLTSILVQGTLISQVAGALRLTGDSD